MIKNTMRQCFMFDEINEFLRLQGILSAVVAEITCEPDVPLTEYECVDVTLSGPVYQAERMGTYGDVVIRLKVLDKQVSQANPNAS